MNFPEVSPEEEEKIKKNVFQSLEPLRLKVLSSKAKKKAVILKTVAAQFERGRTYSETDVNGILRPIYPDDSATLRRGLIEAGYLDRKPDGSAYWLK